MPEVSNQRKVAAILSGLAAVLYVLIGWTLILRGNTWADEIAYLIRSTWYLNGVIAPYSDQDATWYMPLFFYQLGAAQEIFGRGHLVGRTMSWLIGGASGVLIYYACRHLTSDRIASAAALLIYASPPATMSSFSTATPYASVAFLHALALWIIITRRAKNSYPWTAALGALCAVMFLYRQNMILGVCCLAPYYVAGLGRQRAAHAAVLAFSAGLVFAVVFAVFPEKLMYYAIRLPVVTPILDALGWLSPNLHLIQTATQESALLSFSPDKISKYHLWNGFLMPYLGSTVAVGLSIAIPLARRDIPSFWPCYFTFLVIGHYLGSIGFAPDGLTGYTNYFVGAAAVSSAIAFTEGRRRLAARSRVGQGVAVFAVILLSAVNITSSATYWTLFAQGRSQSSWYPKSRVAAPGVTPDPALIDQIRNSNFGDLLAGRRVLLVSASAAVTYALAAAGHVVPPQSFDLRSSHRRLVASLDPNARAKALIALEGESLWSDETMERWLTSEFDVVVDDAENTTLSPALNAVLARDFAARSRFRRDGLDVVARVRTPGP